MTATPTTDRTRELLTRARAAEDERDALARQVTSLQLKINRLQAGEPSETEVVLTRQVETLTRQLKRAALTEPDADARRERDRGAAAVTALREANVVLTRERERLQAANEALKAQVDVLQRANRTLANQERSE